jgi:hypothetical protein
MAIAPLQAPDCRRKAMLSGVVIVQPISPALLI